MSAQPDINENGVIANAPDPHMDWQRIAYLANLSRALDDMAPF